MSVLNRISTILRANINDLLDRAEDPEKMLNQIVLDMAEGIREAKGQVTEAIAQSKLLEGDLKQARDLSVQWQRKAELAVSRGADDLARECLRRKRDYDANILVYEPQVAAQQSAVSKLKVELSLLESKYAEIQRNRDLLLVRHQRAKAQERVLKTVAAVSITDPTSSLSRMEERIRLKEARVAAAGELAAGALDSRLAGLTVGDSDFEIEVELLEMKSRLEPPQLTSGEEPSSSLDETQNGQRD